jgi:hypothetical protein
MTPRSSKYTEIWGCYSHVAQCSENVYFANSSTGNAQIDKPIGDLESGFEYLQVSTLIVQKYAELMVLHICAPPGSQNQYSINIFVTTDRISMIIHSLDSYSKYLQDDVEIVRKYEDLAELWLIWWAISQWHHPALILFLAIFRCSSTPSSFSAVSQPFSTK